MTPSPSDPTLTNAALRRSVQLVDVAGFKVSVQALKELLPDTETALFFARAYKMDAYQVGQLLSVLFNTTLVNVLLNESDVHSSDLQDYLVDIVPPDVWAQVGADRFDPSRVAPDDKLLVQLFENATVEVASAIEDVVRKLGTVLDSFPSRYGTMVFEHMHKLNRQYNAIGTYEATIARKQTPPRLVILDVSGSMSHSTVQKIVEPVVALAYEINASLAIVSNTTTAWVEGSYGVQDVLAAAEYGGTHYETLAPLLDNHWQTVVTIADYDSSPSAKNYLRTNATGTIGEVFDISLVGQPTFLAECVGQFAQSVTPLLVAGSNAYLR